MSVTCTVPLPGRGKEGCSTTGVDAFVSLFVGLVDVAAWSSSGTSTWSTK